MEFLFKNKGSRSYLQKDKRKKVVAIYDNGLKRKICTKAGSRPKLLQAHATMSNGKKWPKNHRKTAENRAKRD